METIEEIKEEAVEKFALEILKEIQKQKEITMSISGWDSKIICEVLDVVQHIIKNKYENR